MKCIISEDIHDVEKLEFTRNKLHQLVFSNESLKTTFLTILNTRLGRNDKNKLNEVFLNTFHLGDQISQFIKKKKFPINKKIIQDKAQILGTGGGILNMINTSVEKDFFIFNPDTLWS